MQKHTEHPHGQPSSAPLRQALDDHFTPEFGQVVLGHFNVNGVIPKPADMRFVLKATLTQIAQNGDQTKGELASKLITTPELSNRKGDELKRAGEEVRTLVVQVLMPHIN